MSDSPTEPLADYGLSVERDGERWIVRDTTTGDSIHSALTRTGAATIAWRVAGDMRRVESKPAAVRKPGGR